MDQTKYIRKPVRMLLLWLMCLGALLAFASPAHAADNTYTGKNYDASVSGCVDLMKYMKRITLTVNDVDYTSDQLKAMKDRGEALQIKPGDTASFNFLFSLNGRAYADNDETRQDWNKSTKVTYSNGTTYANGESVRAGETGVLDDSILMEQNKQVGSSFLRMDIGWLLKLGPGGYEIEYESPNLSFYQGTGENSNYLYLYFPKGLGGDIYAGDGYFTITINWTQNVKEVHVPGSDGYYVPGTDGWDFVVTQEFVSSIKDANIDTYSSIIVEKKWLPANPDGQARILLHYTKGGQEYTATRTLTNETPRGEFDIQNDMTNCWLEEDMTGLDGYTCTMTQNGNTFTFTNSKGTPVKFSKKTITGADELPGARLELYGVWNDGTESLIDQWDSGTEPHEVTLYPNNYRLHEVSAPAGYAVSTDVTFTVTNDLTVKLTGDVGGVEGNTVTITDRPLEVKFAKVDGKGNALAGASLQLTDLNTGKVVDSWTSGSEPHTITYQTSGGTVLIAGHTYELKELAAPSGYRTAEAITFVFNGDGTIPNCPYHTVTMTDQPVTTATPTPATPTTPTTPTSPGTPVGSVQTGDNPMMWVFLALALVCLAASVFVAWLGFWGDDSRRIYKWR